ncbi:hypothetical protein SCATT_10510 [Streptantibioticus cattleyicolor NRRL 8057 = DSM 46488]|uniref:Uncharacterized protein n=1 Tax=Streptantibioticus cattleyicolor (strain ATCC 35852 / DSM 46488 / JCM 4925 / NBRC 14057 / NRRL 8057) TaxID=1003195 RepID=G8WNV0_STREN|nr:hypothetical protein SCATT_10510 [Streptantibioticus cattleyicolor NRRL 8057 = DSM 46488]
MSVPHPHLVPCRVPWRRNGRRAPTVAVYVNMTSGSEVARGRPVGERIGRATPAGRAGVQVVSKQPSNS